MRASRRQSKRKSGEEIATTEPKMIKGLRVRADHTCISRHHLTTAQPDNNIDHHGDNDRINGRDADENGSATPRPGDTQNPGDEKRANPCCPDAFGQGSKTIPTEPHCRDFTSGRTKTIPTEPHCGDFTSGSTGSLDTSLSAMKMEMSALCENTSLGKCIINHEKTQSDNVLVSTLMESIQKSHHHEKGDINRNEYSTSVVEWGDRKEDSSRHEKGDSDRKEDSTCHEKGDVCRKEDSTCIGKGDSDRKEDSTCIGKGDSDSKEDSTCIGKGDVCGKEDSTNLVREDDVRPMSLSVNIIDNDCRPQPPTKGPEYDEINSEDEPASVSILRDVATCGFIEQQASSVERPHRNEATYDYNRGLSVQNSGGRVNRFDGNPQLTVLSRGSEKTHLNYDDGQIISDALCPSIVGTHEKTSMSVTKEKMNNDDGGHANLGSCQLERKITPETFEPRNNAEELLLLQTLNNEGVVSVPPKPIGSQCDTDVEQTGWNSRRHVHGLHCNHNVDVKVNDPEKPLEGPGSAADRCEKATVITSNALAITSNALAISETRAKTVLLIPETDSTIKPSAVETHTQIKSVDRNVVSDTRDGGLEEEEEEGGGGGGGDKVEDYKEKVFHNKSLSADNNQELCAFATTEKLQNSKGNHIETGTSNGVVKGLDPLDVSVEAGSTAHQQPDDGRKEIEISTSQGFDTHCIIADNLDILTSPKNNEQFSQPPAEDNATTQQNYHAKDILVLQEEGDYKSFDEDNYDNGEDNMFTAATQICAHDLNHACVSLTLDTASASNEDLSYNNNDNNINNKGERTMDDLSRKSQRNDDKYGHDAISTISLQGSNHNSCGSSISISNDDQNTQTNDVLTDSQLCEASNQTELQQKWDDIYLTARLEAERKKREDGALLNVITKELVLINRQVMTFKREMATLKARLASGSVRVHRADRKVIPGGEAKPVKSPRRLHGRHTSSYNRHGISGDGGSGSSGGGCSSSGSGGGGGSGGGCGSTNNVSNGSSRAWPKNHHS